MTFVENRFDVSFLLLEIERVCQLTKFHQNLAPAIATFIKKARTFHPGVLFQSFSFFRITEKKKEGGKPISSSSTFISFPYEIANHGRSVIACPLSLSLWNDIRLARGQKKSEDKALSSSSDLPEIVRRPSRPYASPDICLNLFGSFRNLNSNFLSEDYFENFDIYIYWWAISEFWLFKTRRRRTA